MADEDELADEAGAERAGPNGPRAIVGVGVAAGSLPALEAVFAGLEEQAEAAYLVVLLQQDGLDVATVVNALERRSAFSVTRAADGERIATRHVYVCAPDELLTIVDGHLRTRPTTEPAGQRGGLDSLFISLAEHAQERAVAVLLSGLGSEGSAGIVATKKYGGLSIAEASDGDAAGPGASSPTAVADLHLPAERIAHEITRYVRSLGAILQEERAEGISEVEAQVTQITTVLRNVTGHDFHGYKRGTFVRRVHRRMQVMQIDGGMEAYLERLRSDREEVRHLFQDLLIGVTQFFRDPAEFDALERELPRLFAAKEPEDQFRVWVLGCATGEEAYSLAILLREQMAMLDRPPAIQIFATDLDANALNLARAGRYAATIANHVRADRLERWFVREGDTYCVSKELREMCIFSPHNIVKDAPFSRIDILSCRNLLIYLSTELQNRVIPIFHFSLRPDGILFLGSSENVTRHGKLFAPVDRKARVFRRLETATRIIPDFPLSPRVRGGEAAATQLSRLPPEGRLPAAVGRQADAVAERYAPAYVVVDTAGEVLHFSGRTGRYLEPSTGAATLNLTNLVHRDLRIDVRTALARAIAEARRVEVPRLTLRQDDRAYAVTVVVEPLSAGDVTALLVLFQDLGLVAEGVGAEGDRLSSDEHVQRLEAELRVTRDRLQATIEELESTNEELKSSNEEYQSINEELQSANEEMETSKEELQSVNEELQTVNGELAHRVQELGRTNSDMKNLLEATQIATVFLDNDLRIRNFTPAATDIFHLLDTDVGRPLDHVVARVSYPELIDDVRRVLKTLTPVERQVSDAAAGRHFQVRVLPYRSIDNYISGAVATFTDLTAVRQAQAALRESEALRLVALVGGRMGAWRWDLDAALIWGDAQLWSLWGYPPSDDPRPLSDFNDRMSSESAADVAAVVARAIAAGEQFDGPLEIVAGPTAGHSLRWQGRADDDNPKLLYGVSFDVTEQRRAEEALRRSEEGQVFLLKLTDTLRPLADPGEIERQATRLLGEHLQADRCFLSPVYEDGSGMCVREEYLRSGASSVLGDYTFAQFGDFVGPTLHGGHVLAVEDVDALPGLNPDERASYVATGIRAYLLIPLVRDGRLAAFLTINHRTPRPWSNADKAIAWQAADRLWTARERARAEAALRDSEAIRSVALAGGRMGTWRWDLAKRLVWGDAEFLALWGLPPSDEPLPLSLFTDRQSPEGQAQTHEIVTKAIESDEEFDAPIEVASGPTAGRWLRWRGRAAPGDPSMLYGVSFDITDQRQVDARVRASEERFRALATASSSMIYRMSADWRVMYQLDGRGVLVDTVAPVEDWAETYLFAEDRQAIFAVIEEAIRTRSLFELEHRVRTAPGGSGWVLSRAVPMLRSDGEIAEWFGAGTDIDARKRVEEALRDREANLRVLVAELQHRVRNILTVIGLTFMRTFEGEGDKDEMAAHFKGRLDAMARTQVLLTRTPDRTANLENLIRDELLSVGVSDGLRLAIEGPEVVLDHKRAEALSMAFHELTTNALKYGAIKIAGASLRISWAVNIGERGRPVLNLIWLEQGVPTVSVRPTHEGFGRELIEEALPYRLGAETRLEFRGGGVRCSISVPLADGDEPARPDDAGEPT